MLKSASVVRNDHHHWKCASSSWILSHPQPNINFCLTAIPCRLAFCLYNTFSVQTFPNAWKKHFFMSFFPSSSLPSSSICYMFTLLMVPSHSQSLLFSSICVFIAGNKIFLICIQIIFTHFKKKWPRKRAKRRKTGCAKWWTGNKQFVTCQICSFYLNFIQIRWPWFAIIFSTWRNRKHLLFER